MLNFSSINYPSCKIPFLPSHTFHVLSPSFLRMHCSSISVQPGYYLIMLKVSQKPGFQPKVLNRGHNLADMDCGMFGSVFPGLLYTEWLKGSQGCCRCSVRENISVMVYLTTARWVTQIIPEMSRTNSKMKKVDKGQTCKQIWQAHKYSKIRWLRKCMPDICLTCQEEYLCYNDKTIRHVYSTHDMSQSKKIKIK